MIWFILSLSLSFGIWFYFIYRHDKIKKEPLYLLFLVAGFGGFMAVILAGGANALASKVTGYEQFINENEISTFTGSLFMLCVGINEEFIKFFITLAFIARLKEFDEPIDGIIYAMTLALGFAMIENISYMTRFGTNIILLRSVTSVPLHLGLAALWGTGLTKNRFSVFPKGYFRTALPFLLLAALIHAGYNSAGFYLSPATTVLLAFVIAMLLIYFAHYKMKEYLKRSPFLPVGFCLSCGRLNTRYEKICKKCGNPLQSE